MSDTPDTPRPLKGWWTVAAGMAVVIIGQLQTWDWAHMIPAQYVGQVVSWLGIAMIVLRALTDTKIGSSK